jgi:hypothetical protein
MYGVPPPSSGRAADRDLKCKFYLINAEIPNANLVTDSFYLELYCWPKCFEMKADNRSGVAQSPRTDGMLQEGELNLGELGMGGQFIWRFSILIEYVGISGL